MIASGIPVEFTRVIEAIIGYMSTAYNLIMGNWILSIFVAIFIVSKVFDFIAVDEEGKEHKIKMRRNKK